MVQIAFKHNRTLIEQGRVRLEKESIEKIPFEDTMFDKVFTVNTIYFWEDTCRALQEMKRVLKTNGRLVIGFRSKARMEQWDLKKQEVSLFTPDENEVKSLLKEAGYIDIKIEHFMDKSKEFYCAIARK